MAKQRKQLQKISTTAEEEVETEEPAEGDSDQEGQKKTSSDLTDSIVCPICSTSNPAGCSYLCFLWLCFLSIKVDIPILATDDPCYHQRQG